MNGKMPCKSNRPKERAKTVDDFDHCVIKRTIHGLYKSQPSIKPSLRVPACKTIKRLPEGIFGESDPSFGSHI
jgi:hypothetical protein